MKTANRTNMTRKTQRKSDEQGNGAGTHAASGVSCPYCGSNDVSKRTQNGCVLYTCNACESELD